MIQKRLKRILVSVLLLVILLLLLVVISEYKFKNDIIIGMKPKEIEDIYGKPGLRRASSCNFFVQKFCVVEDIHRT